MIEPTEAQRAQHRAAYASAISLLPEQACGRCQHFRPALSVFSLPKADFAGACALKARNWAVWPDCGVGCVQFAPAIELELPKPERVRGWYDQAERRRFRLARLRA